MSEMTRDEALDVLWTVAQYCRDERMAGIQNLRDTINALSSCACRGREPLHRDRKAKLWHVMDDIYRMDIHISGRFPSLWPQQEVDVEVIVVLAEEEKT